MAIFLRAFFLMLFAWPAIAAALSDSRNTADLERQTDRIFAAYDRPDSPGCALGVIHEGALVYRKGYGSASLEMGVPITPQSVFYMGSVSKQFTAASVVLASEQGLLSLDDDVRKYVPELPSWGRTITLRHMLHHTSGLRDIFTLLFLAGRNAEDIHTTPELLDLIASQRSPNFMPGDEYSYSNTNFFLLGVVIQRATGKPLSRFAEENIFRPLSMKHTRFYDDRTMVVPGRVAAYEPRDGGGFSVDWSTEFDKVGDGGLLSSVEDMLLWDRNFYDNKLGKGALPTELQTRGFLNNGKSIEYALGLVMTSYRGLPVAGHFGALFGYRTAFLRFPRQKFSVIGLCNLETSNPGDMVEKVADLWLDGEFPPETSSPPAVQSDPRPFAGMYRDAASHTVLEVSVNEGGLTVYGQRLKATGPGRFHAEPGTDIQVERPDGAALRFTLTAVDTPPQTFERFQPIKVATADLLQYEGAYMSSELETTYRFRMENGKLTLRTNWREPVVFEPVVRDEFRSAQGVTIVFQRDRSGHIADCGVFAGRVRNIRFVKIRSRGRI